MNSCDCTCHEMSSAFATCSGKYADGGCGHVHRVESLPDLRALVGLGPRGEATSQPAQLRPTVAAPVPESDPGPEEHRCYRGERCADSEKVEIKKGEYERKGARIMAAQGLCVTCQRVTTTAIAELPRDYVELHLALERGSAGIQEVVAATKDLPAALRINIAALAAEMVRVALAWAELVAERLNVAWDSTSVGRHMRPGPALQRATQLLSRSAPVLFALRGVEVETWADNGWYRSYDPTDGLDGALWMLRLHQVTRAALGQTKLVHELSAPCPNCDHLALVRDSGDDHVHCRHCRLQWPEADYARLTLVVAADYKDVDHRRPSRVNRPRSSAEGTVGRSVPVA